MDKYTLPPYVLSRVRYYDGAFLLDDEFIDEQKYHIDRRQRHDRLLHLSGVCEGLVPSILNATTIVVTAGTAIDDQGQQILVDADRSLAVAPGTSGQLYIELLFNEVEALPATQTSGGAPPNRRFAQQPILRLMATPSAHAVVLGRAAISVVTGGASNVTQVTTIGRVYSGLRLAGENGSVYSLRATQAGTVELAGLANVPGTPQFNLAGNVGISVADTQGNRLRVNGNTLLDGTLTLSGTNSLTVGGNLTVRGKNILTELVPVGTVLPWWRPAQDVPLPAGFEICDGRSIAAGQHDFRRADGTALAQAVTLPDLRNAFILGANPDNAQGTAATAGDLATNAPGIGGVGGSNATRSIDHKHNVTLNHQHGAMTSASASRTQTAGVALNTASAGSHYHDVSSAFTNWFDGPNPNNVRPTLTDPKNAWQPMMPAHSTQISGDHYHFIPSHTHEMDHTHNVNAFSFTGSVKTDVVDTGDPKTVQATPRYVGLLMIMRVR